MASEQVKTFTDASFQTEVLNSDQPVLVDFWAEWCMPCKMLTPTIDALATDFAGSAKIGKFDIDSNRQVPTQYGIQAIPTIILFKGGQPVKKWVGITKKDELAAALKDAAGATA